MGFGVKEVASLEHVPGTAFLEDSSVQSSIDTTGLKHATGRNAHIVLVPQPSNDPNDPLNWPTWRKQSFFWTLNAGVCLIIAAQVAITNAYVPLSMEFQVSIQEISYSSGVMLAATLVGFPFSSAIAVKFGRRPAYFMSIWFLIAGEIYAAKARNYGDLMGARVIQGFGVSPLEGVIQATLGDLFFVHERGLMTGLWEFCIQVSGQLVGILSGYTVSNLGWRWIYWLLLIFTCVYLFAFLLLMPETAYNRNPLRFTDQVGIADAGHVQDLAEKQEEARHLEADYGANGDTVLVPKRSFLKDMRLFTGQYSKKSFLHLLFRPWVMLVSPIVWYGIFIHGLLQTWNVVLSVSLAQLFSAPPYLFSPSSLGDTFVSPLIAAILGTLTAGPFCDYLAKRCSIANKGVYEPEFRLFPAIVSGLFAVFGFVGYGISMNEGDPWIAPVISEGLIYFGIAVGNTFLFSYVLDAHRALANEAVAAISIIRNGIALGFTFFMNAWIAEYGTVNVFGILAGVTAFTHLLTVIESVLR